MLGSHSGAVVGTKAEEYLRVSENRGPQYNSLNSRYYKDPKIRYTSHLGNKCNEDPSGCKPEGSELIWRYRIWQAVTVRSILYCEIHTLLTHCQRAAGHLGRFRVWDFAFTVSMQQDPGSTTMWIWSARTVSIPLLLLLL